MRYSLRRAAVLALCASACACSSSTSGGPAGPASDAAGDGESTTKEAGASDATVADAPSGQVDATAGDGAAVDAAEGDAPGDAGVDSSFDGGNTGCALDPSNESTELRCTGLYSDWPSRTISPGVVEFDPGLHLWSDGAVKTRWMYLPPGQKIDTSNMDEWTFPVGTRFWKQFVVGGVLIETRMIHKVAVGDWYLTTYQWSSDASSTTELTTGAVGVNDAGYEIPNQQKCGECHQGRADYVLGFEAVSLSSPDAGGMPMTALEAHQLITDFPDASLAIPGTPTEVAALGYLHANCGITCHNPDNGFAKSTGFFMRLNVAEMAAVQSTDAYRTGWNQPTYGFHIPGAAQTDRLAQCDLGSSCVFYRMSHRDGLAGTPSGTQMPPIDTHITDPNGIAVLSAWIEEGCEAGVSDAGGSPVDAQSDVAAD